METEPYKKIAFVWEEPQPLVAVPERLIFRSYEDAGRSALEAVVGRVMNNSLDRSDRKHASEHDPIQLARISIDDTKKDFDYQLSWWQLAFDTQSNLVGFVQPVVFRDCKKGSLEEGTIYYIGVTPEARGRGYVRDLLLKGTRVLQEVGMWRIYCDTDVVNKPMIAAFERIGYQQFGEPQEKPM